MEYLDFNKKVRVINLLKIEKLKRTMFIKWYFKKLMLRSVFKVKRMKRYQKSFIIFKMSFFPRYSLITQMNTRCFRTGRSHMPFRYALLARMQLRIFAKQGLLPHTYNAVI